MKNLLSIKVLVIIIVCLLFVQKGFAEKNKELDSLNNLLKKAKDDTTKIRIRYDFGHYSNINRIGYFDSIKIDCEKLLKTSKDRSTKEVINYFLGYSLIKIGYFYNLHSDIPKSLEYYFNSLKIMEGIEFKQGIANALNNIGSIYNTQGDFSNALEYFNKCLKISEVMRDTAAIANSLNNIGTIYKKQLKYSKALEYFQRSLDISTKSGYGKLISYSLINIGYIYKINKDFSNALYYFEQGLCVSEQIVDNIQIANSLVSIGELYLEKNEPIKAKNFAAKAYKISKELGFPGNIKMSAELLKKINIKEGNYKEAFKYYELENQMHDSIVNDKNLIFTQKQQAKYEFGKKVALDSIANSKAMIIKNLKIGKQKVIIYFFSGGFIIILILLIIIFRLFLQKGKAINKLAHQNEEIHNQRNEIEIQRDKLNKQNLQLEEQKQQLENKQTIIEQEITQLMAKNMEAENQQLKQQIHPHFLFNSLCTLKILIENNNKIAKDYIMHLSDFLRVSISSNIENVVTIKDEIKFCIDYLEMQKIRFEDALQYNINIPGDIQNSGNIPIFSIQQLLENSIKHNTFSSKKPLNINIFHENDRIFINNNIQKKFKQETSTGIGLKNISERYRILSGDEVIINNDDKIFSVSIKILNK
jgi:sensor histidine kinase YesM